MKYENNNKGTLINLKKRDLSQYLNKNCNNSNFFQPSLSYNNNCKCSCHNRSINNNDKFNNTVSNYNSEINSNSNFLNDSNINQKYDRNNHQEMIRNKSMNYVLSLNDNNLFKESSKIYTTNYNYNFNYFDNVDNGIIYDEHKSKSNEKIYSNEKIDITKNESENNLSKSYIVSKNKKSEKKPKRYSIEILGKRLYEYYHDVSPIKYNYGNPKLKISKNKNNHSYKEIFGRSASSGKIPKKRFVSTYINSNICKEDNNNYNYQRNTFTQVSPYNNIRTNINYDICEQNNYNYNNNNIHCCDCTTGYHKEMKKSTSENILNRNINTYQNCINNYNENDSNCFKENKITYEIKYQNNLYNNDDGNINNCNSKYNDINIDKNDYLLKFKTDNNINNKYNPSYDLNNRNNNFLNNNNNLRYYYTFKKNYYQNKKTIPKTNSVDNYNIMKCNYLNTISNTKKKTIKDFNYEQFKLRAKLGFLNRESYKKEINTRNNNRLSSNYLTDKKYLDKMLNNKKKLGIKDIVLEKTKKLLEERKLQKEKKLRNNNDNKNNNESQILYNLKKNLMENNKKNSNKHAVKPKLNIFKS